VCPRLGDAQGLAEGDKHKVLKSMKGAVVNDPFRLLTLAGRPGPFLLAAFGATLRGAVRILRASPALTRTRSDILRIDRAATRIFLGTANLERIPFLPHELKAIRRVGHYRINARRVHPAHDLKAVAADNHGFSALSNPILG
jgi:hypothetical protein